MPGMKIKIDVAEAERAAARLKKELKTLGHTAVDNEAEFKKLEDRMLKGLKADKAEKSIDALRKSMHLTRLETVKLQTSIGDYGGALRTLSATLKPTTASMVALGASMAAIGAVGVKSLSEFSTLDEGLINVQKTTNLTDKGMKVLSASIQDMAANIPVTTERLLEIAGAAGQLGVKGVQNIEVFTKTLAKLEIASDIAGEEAAKSLARLMNVAGESVSEVETLGSVIVALGNNMAASESEIVSLATEVGLATSTFSVSSAEAAALGAAMRSMGVRAELGGSVVGRAMRSIEDAINAGGDSFQELQRLTGMAGDQLKRTFQTDATSVFQSWISGVGRVIEGGETAASVLDKFGLRGEEVLKVLPTMAVRSSELGDALRIAAKETESATALNEEAIRASESFASQMRMTMNVVDSIAASIGSGLAPTIVQITKDFRDWADENEEFIRIDLPQYLNDIATASGVVTDALTGVARNVAVNAQAFALAKGEQISWLDFITASTDELALMVKQYDALAGTGVSLKEWRNELDDLTEKYERLGDQIETGQRLNVLSSEGLKNLKAQREEIAKQIEGHKALVEVKKESSAATKENSEAEIKILKTKDGLLKKNRAAWAKAERDRALAEKKRLEESKRALDVFSAEYNKAVLSSFDYELKKIEEQYDYYDEYVTDKLKLEEWFSAELQWLLESRNKDEADALEQRIKNVDGALDDFFGDIDAAYDDHYAELKRKADEYADDVKDANKDLFKNLEGLTYDLMDNWDNLGDFIVDTMRSAAMKAASAWLTTNFVMPLTLNVGGMMGASWNGIPMGDMGGGLFSAASGGFNALSGLKTGWDVLSGGLTSSAYSMLSTGYGAKVGSAIFGAGTWLGGPTAAQSGILAGGGSMAEAASLSGGAFNGGLAADFAGAAPLLAIGAGVAALGSYLQDLDKDEPAIVLTNKKYRDEIETYQLDNSTDRTIVHQDAILDPNGNWARGATQIADFDMAMNNYRVGDKVKNRSGLWGDPEYTLSEFSQAVLDYVTGYFTAIDDSFSEAFDGVSVRDAIGSMPDFRYEIDADIEKLPELLDDVFIGIQENLYGQFESFTGTALDGQIFDSEFLKAIAAEGEGLFDTFYRFGETVQKTTGFIDQMDLQMSEFGESAADAYNNIVIVNTTLDTMNATLEVIGQSSTIAAIEAVEQQWISLIDTLEAAHATTFDLTQAEMARNQAMGASITGLTADNISQALLSGSGVESIVNANIAQTVAGFAGQEISMMSEGVTAMVGAAWNDGGIEALMSLDLSGEMENITSAAQSWIDTINEITGAESELANTRDTASQSIEDLIRELEGGSLAPVQSMEYFKQQYLEAAGAVANADSPEALNTAMSNYTSVATDYLDYAQDYGGNYKDAHADVLAAANAYQSGGQASFGGTIVLQIGKDIITNFVVDVLENNQEAQNQVIRISANG